jgi:hypothetical protein
LEHEAEHDEKANGNRDGSVSAPRTAIMSSKRSSEKSRAMRILLITPIAFCLLACGSSGGPVSSDASANDSATTSSDGASESSLEGGSETGSACTGDSVTEACFLCLSASCCGDLKACLADGASTGCKTQFLYFEACQTSHLTGCWSSVVPTNSALATCASAHCSALCHD